jgi:peptidoglycan/xylan/chitin deacetylase (PgdA/CDA1 family)
MNNSVWGIIVNEDYKHPYTNYSSIIESNNKNSITERYAGCNCVIFRMDDIQDYWLNSIQNAVMNLFLTKNQTLSLGSIMNMIGNDSKIVEKIKEGIKEKLFELDIHGWNHVDYASLSEKEQKNTLIKSKEKMQQIFGTNSSVFIPPLNLFDHKVLNTMKDLNLNIISSGIKEEMDFNQNKSILNSKSNSNKLSTESAIENNKRIYHIPATTFFKYFNYGLGWSKTPIDEIFKNATNNIDKYGYAVIVLHPQDFALASNENGAMKNTFVNSIDKREISDLSKLLDYSLSNNIQIKGFGEVIKHY